MAQWEQMPRWNLELKNTQGLGEAARGGPHWQQLLTKVYQITETEELFRNWRHISIKQIIYTCLYWVENSRLKAGLYYKKLL